MTQRSVAERLEWSPSKVIRIESGDTGVSAVDLRALCQLYQLTDADSIERLLSWARYSRRLPYVQYAEILNKDSITFFGYEDAAAVIRQVEPLVIPGLLQTDDYAAEILGLRQRDERVIENLVDVRRARQEALSRSESPPQLNCILDESVLRRVVGGPSVFARQLEALREASTRPNVSIRVLPFTAGATLALGGPFIVLEFSDVADPPFLYIENPREGAPRINERDESIGPFLDSFIALEEVASPAEQFPSFLDRALRDLE
jgi:transcriptional regulator with XRE-family HTH domain